MLLASKIGFRRSPESFKLCTAVSNSADAVVSRATAASELTNDASPETIPPTSSTKALSSLPLQFVIFLASQK